MAESCKKYDLKLGLYYSQVIDWHEKYTGYFKNKETGAQAVHVLIIGTIKPKKEIAT